MFDFAFNDIIRNNDGNIYIIKGKNIPRTKLEIESLIKEICVFWYTAQKQVIKYQ